MTHLQARCDEGESLTEMRNGAVHAFLALVHAKGLRNVTLSLVARHMGKSVHAVKEAFPTRAELIDAAAAAGFNQLVAVLESALSPLQRAARADTGKGRCSDCDALRAALSRAYVRFAHENPALYEVMFSAPARSSAHAHLASKAAHELKDTLNRVFGQAKSREAWQALHCGSARWERTPPGRKRRAAFERGFGGP